MPHSVVIEDLLKQVEIPTDGTLSRTLHRDDHVKIVLFGFAGGQELSQHTAAVPAILEIVQGEARVTLDNAVRELSAGAWVFMDAQLPHAIYAKTPLIMLLTMLTGAGQQ